MLVTIFYRPNSEHARQVEEFVRDFSRQHPETTLKLLNVDSREGIEEVKLYDVVQYPTVIAAANDGSPLQRWDNGMMPLSSELAYYTNQ